MIRPIFFGNAEQPGALSNVSVTKQPEQQVPKEQPDTFTPSAKTEEANPQPDPNDKFEKSEEKSDEK